MSKRKTRKETIDMINKERNKVLSLSITTSAINITSYLDNIVMNLTTNYTLTNLFMQSKKLAQVNKDIERELNEDLKILEEEYDKNFPPLLTNKC